MGQVGLIWGVMDELERQARRDGWFLTTHSVGEKTFWQWRLVADPENGRHGIFWDEAHARAWMELMLKRSAHDAKRPRFDRRATAF